MAVPAVAKFKFILLLTVLEGRDKLHPHPPNGLIDSIVRKFKFYWDQKFCADVRILVSGHDFTKSENKSFGQKTSQVQSFYKTEHYPAYCLTVVW